MVQALANAPAGGRSLLEDLEAQAAAAGAETDPTARRPLIAVEGVLESHRCWDSGWALSRLRVEDARGRRVSVSVVGHWVAEPGHRYRVIGVRKVHDRYGEQLEVRQTELVRPADDEGVIAFLAQTLPWVGRAKASSLVRALGGGTAALGALDAGGEAAVRALVEHCGLTDERAEQAVEHYLGSVGASDVQARLARWGLTPYQRTRVLKAFGTRAVEVLEDNPYRLIESIDGFGWHTVDGIARRTGVGDDDARRVRAGVLHTLRELATGAGHTWLPEHKLWEMADKELGLPAQPSRAEVQALIDAGHVRRLEGGGLGAAKILDFEEAIAKAIRAAIASDGLRPVEPRPDTSLTDEQARGVALLCRSQVAVLTGPPGVGKTYTLKAVLAAFEAANLKVGLAAPTGKAAQRMAESTGRVARTVHRLLGWNGGQWTHSAALPLPWDVVVVDEASMLDVELAAALVDAVDWKRARLLFVGDANQLPSVGPGSVLRDLIASGVVPVAQLTKIQRQAEGSAIITNAHRILRGDAPEHDNARLRDWYWQGVDEPKGADPAQIALDVAEQLVHLVVRQLPAAGYDPREHVQVLSPMRKGPIGTFALNAALQKALNPPEAGKGEVKFGRGRVLREGDRIIQTQNDYHLDVFNGEVGLVVGVGKGEIIAQFGDREVRVPAGRLRNIDLAYAITIHKSQGSQFKVVVVPVHTSHWIMLRRSLIYTGVTRAESGVILVGTERALRRAVTNAEEDIRHTTLRGLLRGDTPATGGDA